VKIRSGSTGSATRRSTATNAATPATVTQALAATLRARGVGDLEAGLAAGAGVAAFHVAFRRWVSDADERPLPEVIEASVAGLRAVAAA
jgi:hypothetical protein